jgi:hypothetical protein
MGGKTSQSSQTIQIPPEVLARYNAVNARAEKASNRGFQEYSSDPNAFVAGLTDAQKAGIQQTMDASGQAQGAISDAYGITQGANRNVDPSQLGASEINQYMNPYMQNVLGSTAALLNQQNQQAMAGQTGNAIRSGAFGGDRGGIAAANLAQQQQMASGKIFSDIASQGYNQALQTAQQQQGLRYQSDVANRQNQAAIAQQLANLGLSGQQAALQGAQAQLGAGQVQQQTEQAGKTALYNQFQQQQSYPFQVAQFLANIAEGTGALSGSTTTSNVPGGFFSDERLKEDIHVVGKTFDGQPIYKYRYKGDPKHQIGLLAQDVEKHHPHAVGLAAGYKTVDYDKATKTAEHKGHFASGGLAAESMGGHVAPEHIGEGYADGGSPALQGLSPADFAAILEAQAKMYAPFSESGMNVSGSPLGGKGYVPEASLPVAGLVTPDMDVPTPESGLEQAANTAQAIGVLAPIGAGAYKLGEKGVTSAANKFNDWIDSFDSASGSPLGEESFASGGLAGYAMGGNPNDQQNSSTSSMPFASAAKAPNEGDQNKLDIPQEQTAPRELMKPDTGSAKDPSMDQFGQLLQIGTSIAAMAGSDKRLKTDIQPVGKTFDGQTVYKYRYKGEPNFRMGLIAQEVEKHHPHAVGLAGGYKTVNYDKATEAAEHRGHFDTGGMPYGGGLSIPTGDGQQRQLLTASSPMPEQQSGLGQLADVASLAQTGMDIKSGFSDKPKTPDAGGKDASADAAASSKSGSSPWMNMLSSGLAGFGLGAMLNGKHAGGLADRKGYAWGGADDSDEFLSQPRFNKDFWLGNKTADQYTADQEQNRQAIKQRDEDINRQLKFGTPEGEYTIGSEGQPIYHPPLTVEQEDINKGLTFGDEKGRKFTLGEGGQRNYVSGGAGSSGLAGGSENKVSAANEQALMDKLRFADAPSVSEGAPIAEATGDVSQMPTTTAVGATGAGGLSPKDAPNVAPVAAAPAPAKAEEAPATGLAGATKPEAKAVTTSDGKPAHWYTNEKYVIPLLQGIAAMGVTPTRSLGVALSSGLGQGLKGYQAQRQFEIDKAAKQASTAVDVATARGYNIKNAMDAAKSIGQNKFTVGGIEYVIPSNGPPMPAYQWNALPISSRPPLFGTEIALGARNIGEVPVSTVPISKDVSTSIPAVVQTGAAPSDDAFNNIKSSLIANSNEISRTGAAERTAEIKKQLDAGASAAFNQEPQIATMANAVSSLGKDSVLSGNTFSDFFKGALLNYNAFMNAIGHPEAAADLEKDLTATAIRDKFVKGSALAAGSSSVQALETALNALPNGQMTRDAAVTLTAALLVDKQKAIDEQRYELNAFNRLGGNTTGYDATNARTEFRKEYGQKYASDKIALTTLMNAVTPDGKSLLGMLLHGEISPQAVDKWIGVPNISRYFITQNR